MNFIIALITGTMKTYWLEKRERRSIGTKGITIQESQWHRNLEKRVSTVGVTGLISPSIFDKSILGDPQSRRGSSKISSPTPAGSSGFFSEERRIYSPITFQDVARRSVANSPTKNVEVRGRIFFFYIRTLRFLF
jgi:guanylate cyclase